MVELFVAIVIAAIVIWGINQIPLPEPFNWLRVVLYCVIAIFLVLYAGRMLRSGSFPGLG